ncbi:hypothetical protein GOB93_13145 [Acetobacter musti]|uniref:HNH endonuclease 5 domain-containing protein n=1 Tax=Acetobacter musti TaxID=864732 RepID=A0ABX0JU81_9PROT|nr:hypothetical protein [Acetobacter musti]NHN85578.1 hypothetical protein [Acetobacter musti]
MKYVEEFIDERLKLPWCMHCGRNLADLKTTRDHIPTKSFLSHPLPEDFPVIEICFDCNNSFSRDGEYTVAFLSSVLSGTTDPDNQINSSASRAMGRSPALRARIDQSQTKHVTDDGITELIWEPDRERVNRIVVKNARGHALFEAGHTLNHEPAEIQTVPLSLMSSEQQKEFETEEGHSSFSLWPEVGSRMMTRLTRGDDMAGIWVVVQPGIYRYAVREDGDRIRIKSVIFEYLATEVTWEDAY